MPVQDREQAAPSARRAPVQDRSRGGRKTGTWHSRRLLSLATVVVTIVFSYIALSGINFKLAWDALRSCNYWWLIPALVAFGLGNVARALRWRSLFAPGRRPRPGPTLDAMMIGYFYNNIMPARVGEAARVVVLTQRTPKPVVETVGTVVVERLYDVLTILVIFFVAQPWLPHVSWLKAAAVAAIVLAVAIAAVATALIVYGERPLRFLLRPLGRIFSSDRLARTVTELAHGLSGLRNRGVAVEAFLWTIAAWMLTALCAYLVSIAFHLGLPFACGVLVAVAVGLSMILPSPPAALGVFEGAAILALNAYGLSKSTILPYALVLHAVNFLPFVLVGLFLLHYNARHPRRLDPAAAAVDQHENQPWDFESTDMESRPAGVTARPQPTPTMVDSTNGHDELWDLENLRTARRLCDWMYEQSQPFVRGDVAEIGAGIGTFSERIAAHKEVTSLLLIEPEPACVEVLIHTFHSNDHVTIARETLPDAPTLRSRAGTFDFLLCQNVLEHIAEEGPAVKAMANALRPGGHITLLVPAHPRLYGNLDRTYGHHRRYTRARLQGLLIDADLEIVDLYSFNSPGIVGWWVNRFRRSPSIGRGSLRAYEALLRVWQPIERRRRLPWGLSVVAHARRPRS